MRSMTLRSRLAIIAAFAFNWLSVPTPAFAEEQATGPKKECIELTQGQLTGDGVAFTVGNLCQICIKFSPRVHLPDNSYMPVSAGAVLGAPVFSMKLQPGAHALLGYSSHQAGQSVPVMQGVEEC